jgi:hypothetical protein
MHQKQDHHKILLDLKEETDSNIVIIGDLNILFSLMDKLGVGGVAKVVEPLLSMHEFKSQ